MTVAHLQLSKIDKNTKKKYKTRDIKHKIYNMLLGKKHK